MSEADEIRWLHTLEEAVRSITDPKLSRRARDSYAPGAEKFRQQRWALVHKSLRKLDAIRIEHIRRMRDREQQP